MFVEIVGIAVCTEWLEIVVGIESVVYIEDVAVDRLVWTGGLLVPSVDLSSSIGVGRISNWDGLLGLVAFQLVSSPVSASVRMNSTVVHMIFVLLLFCSFTNLLSPFLSVLVGFSSSSSSSSSLFESRMTSRDPDTITFDAAEIIEANTIKYLGLTLDKNLSWRSHIEGVNRQTQPIFAHIGAADDI